MKIKKQKVSPRQKMINLMYVLLMAMLALNVSSDVLKGFELVDDSLSNSTENATKQNEALYSEFDKLLAANTEKAGDWYHKAQEVRNLSNDLYNYAEELKIEIAKKADGENGDYKNLNKVEDLEAATYVMLAPGSGKGEELCKKIENYRTNILAYTEDETQRTTIESNFSTAIPDKNTALGKNWQEYYFENTPAIAAITLLTKLQNDIRYSEGEIVHSLLKKVDVGDVRVNQIQALVIPSSKSIVRGSDFTAEIILAAVDSTQRPQIYIDDKLLETENGSYSIRCNKTGEHTLKGYMTVSDGAGAVTRYDFSQRYTVVEPSATVSATMMNVLYAGYENPISISVPGVNTKNISASIAEGKGSIKADGKGGFILIPTTPNEEVKVRVTATVEGGKAQSMGEYAFRVRRLPDPTPFIEYKEKDGSIQRYRGGTPLAKQQLMSTDGIVAAIDDGLLNIGFRVVSFETTFFDNMGNAVPEQSNGAKFSDRQKNMFRNLQRGKRFYISKVKAVGPDGIERQLPTSLEVIIK